MACRMPCATSIRVLSANWLYESRSASVSAFYPPTYKAWYIPDDGFETRTTSLIAFPQQGFPIDVQDIKIREKKVPRAIGRISDLGPNHRSVTDPS